METVSIPTSVPAELKAADLILKRARELKTHDPVMAYWCCYRAAQIGVADKRTDDGTMVLLDLLDALEKMKELLDDNDAVTNEVAGQAYVENFALNVFSGADDEDRAGKATKATVGKFLAAATFFEVIKSFGEGETLNSEMEAKLKYARFKAASLAKAFKAGLTPEAGPPGGEKAQAPPPELLAPPSGADEDGMEGLGAGAEAATASSVGETPSEDAVESILFPSTPSRTVSQPSSPFPTSPSTDPSANPSLPSFPQTPGGDNDKEEEESDGVPSAPPAPFNYHPEDAPPTQPIDPTSPVHIHLSPLPPSDLPNPPQPPDFGAPSLPSPSPSQSAPPLPPVFQPPPATARPAPPKPAAHQPPAHTRRTGVPTPAPPPPPPAADDPLTLQEIEKIQKHAKWAISALNYEDVDTARRELTEALRLLG